MVSTEAVEPATTTTLAHTWVTGTRPTEALRSITVVHGFAQNRRCLGPLRDELARVGPLCAVDAPGHGDSTLHASADLRHGARLLTATVGSTDLVGYSMGARLALHAALDAPDQVRSLVLIGGTAGIDDAAERALRRDSDELLARRLETEGLERFIEDWLALPLFAGLPDWARFDEERRSNTAAGLAASLRAAGTGSMDPLWDELGQIRCPVLCVTGARDERYGRLADRIVATVGGPGQHVVIDDAGHAAHLEAPSATSSAIVDFLRLVRS